MMDAHPIAGKNAIAASAFVLIFARPFTPEEVKRLSGLRDRWKNPLPKFEEIRQFSVNIVAGAGTAIAPTMPTPTSGVILRSFKKDGEVAWSLQAADNTVVANCLEYTRWKDEWPRARRYLLSAARMIGSGNLLKGLVLQVVDKFQYDDAPVADYALEEVFDPSSPYLTPAIGKVGFRWHVHQGWFETKPMPGVPPGEQLQSLNLSSAINDGRIVAAVDHTVTLCSPPAWLSSHYWVPGKKLKKALPL